MNGESQKIIAPVITISYTDTGINKKTVLIIQNCCSSSSWKKVCTLPEELNATIEMKDEVRQRGIYNATVYNANIKLKGYFSSKDFPEDKKCKVVCLLV